MRLTVVGKVVVLLLVVGVAVGAWRLWSGSSGNMTESVNSALTTLHVKPRSSQGSGSSGRSGGLLGRPLRVGVVTWPGYAGGIMANDGFKPNNDCIFWKRHQLQVQFMLMEDIDARSKAFAKGGKDGVDIVWSTVDFWANELPGFEKNGLKAKAIMQVDWSRGGDAIVADKSIRKIEDLQGKKIALSLFTPSHWLLEYSLENSSLDDDAQSRIVKGLIGKNASPDASAEFVARKADAAVVWEPDVTDALKKRPDSHILVSSHTAANLIADLMVARQDFIQQHPDVVKAFVEGWLDGTEEANRHPDRVAKLLMENEPVYQGLGEEATRVSLPTVKWAGLDDNTRMFGLDGRQPLFDRIFARAGEAWVKRGYISNRTSPADARDDHFLRAVYGAVPTTARVPVSKEEFQFPKSVPASKRTQAPLMTKPVNIFFASGKAALDAGAKKSLDQVALTAQTYSNAYLRVEGNTDNVGGAPSNVALSQTRAQSVVDYLVYKYGLTRSRFIAKGNGPNKPVASNASDAGRAKNRRTDVMVIPR